METNIRTLVIVVVICISFIEKNAKAVSLERCNREIKDKNLYLMYTERNQQKSCQSNNAKLAFVKTKTVSIIAKCVQSVNKKKDVQVIEVEAAKTTCEKKCFNQICRTFYEIYYQRYTTKCNPRILPKISICQKIVTRSNDNEKNYAVVVGILAVFAVLVAFLTYFYRKKHKVTSISDEANVAEATAFLPNDKCADSNVEKVVLKIIKENSISDSSLVGTKNEFGNELPSTSYIPKIQQNNESMPNKKDIKAVYTNTVSASTVKSKSMMLNQFILINRNFAFSYYLVYQIVKKVKQVHNKNMYLGPRLNKKYIRVLLRPNKKHPNNIGVSFLKIKNSKLNKNNQKLEAVPENCEQNFISTKTNGKFNKSTDIYNLTILLVEIFYGYIRRKQEIPYIEFNKKLKIYLEGDDPFFNRIPLEFKNLVDGVEIWLTIALIEDGLEVEASKRPNIFQFEKNYKNLKLELNDLIDKDERKFKFGQF